MFCTAEGPLKFYIPFNFLATEYVQWVCSYKHIDESQQQEANRSWMAFVSNSLHGAI